MSGISQVECWYDTGYTDGATEMPPVGHTLGDPDLNLLGPFNPAKGREFSEIRLEVPYSDAMKTSYMRLHYDFNNGTDQVFYAWVDSVKLQSDTSEAPLCVLAYHIDPWRTFNSQALYGSGFVVRKPSTDADLYQSFPYRFKTLNTAKTPINKHAVGTGTVFWWALLCVQTKNGTKVSEVRWIAIPLASAGSGVDDLHIRDASNNVGVAPRFDAVISAKLDELMGMDPATVTGAWLCPIKPIGGVTIEGDGTETEPFRVAGTAANEVWQAETRDVSGTKFAWFHTFADPTVSVHDVFASQSSAAVATSTEGHEPVILGPMGEMVGMIPFGKSVTVANLDLVVSSVSACIRIAFGPESEGLVFQYPLPTIDINENSWSSYVYSGQRQYDIEQRNINARSSTVTSMTSGATMGALIGSVVPGIGTAAGAAVGAIGSVVGEAIGGALQTGPFADQFQASEDRLHASQSDSIMLSGAVNYLFYHCTGAELALGTLDYDAEALAMMAGTKAVQGARYGAPVEDCTSLITAGGPLQITNLIVKGNIPTTVKTWIKNKFAAGVRIVSR